MTESSSIEIGVGGAELLEHVCVAEKVGEGVSSLFVGDADNTGSFAFGVASDELGPGSAPHSPADFMMSTAQRGCGFRLNSRMKPSSSAIRLFRCVVSSLPTFLFDSSLVNGGRHALGAGNLLLGDVVDFIHTYTTLEIRGVSAR